jgi:hypothetical protein
MALPSEEGGVSVDWRASTASALHAARMNDSIANKHMVVPLRASRFQRTVTILSLDSVSVRVSCPRSTGV